MQRNLLKRNVKLSQIHNYVELWHYNSLTAEKNLNSCSWVGMRSGIDICMTKIYNFKYDMVLF